MAIPTPPDCTNTSEVRVATCETTQDLQEWLTKTISDGLTTNYGAKSAAQLVTDAFNQYLQTQVSVKYVWAYDWADATARNAQVGMTAGEYGHQIDTDAVYEYNGVSWDLVSVAVGEQSYNVITFEVLKFVSSWDLFYSISQNNTSTTASSVVLRGTIGLLKSKDFDDTTTTTAVYAVGNYIFDTDQNLLYECILINTVGILLTNATYFTAVTVNQLDYLNTDIVFTDGLNDDSTFKRTSKSNQSGAVDFTGQPDDLETWVGIKLSDGTHVFRTTRPLFDVVTGYWTGESEAIGFFRKPYICASGTPQDLRTNIEPLSVNIMDSLEITGILNNTVIAFAGWFSGTKITTTDVILTWGAEIDTETGMASGIYVVPFDGKYSFLGKIQVTHDDTVIGSVRIDMFVNGVSKAQLVSRAVGNTSDEYFYIPFDFLKDLNQDDTIYFKTVVCSATHYIDTTASDRLATNLNIKREGV